MNTKQIERLIVLALQAIPDQFPNGARNPEWTKAVKLTIGKLGEKLGYRVRGHAGFAGWLFDLCWQSREHNEELLNVVLALESEWHRKYDPHIQFDFEKLLVVKSKFKVMVFEASGQTAIDYLNKLERGIRHYKGGSRGEVYVLACYDDAKGQFKIKRIKGE